MTQRKTDDGLLRERILEKARELFNIKGCRFTMDELSRSLGMSKKTLYKVFADKEELLLAMIDDLFDRARENKNFKRRKDAFRTFNETIETIVSWCGMLDPGKVEEMGRKYPQIDRHREERLDESWKETERILTGAMAYGLIDEAPIPVIRILLESFMRVVYGNETLAREGISYSDAILAVSTILMKGTVRGRKR